MSTSAEATLPDALARGAELECAVEVAPGVVVVATASRYPGVAMVGLARRADGTTMTTPEAPVDAAALDAILVALLDRPGLDEVEAGVELSLRAAGRLRWSLRCARDAARGAAAVDAAVQALLALASASDVAIAAEVSAAWMAR